MITIISILSAIIIGLAGFIGKDWLLKQLEKYIDSKYDKELEAYKDKLKGESDKTLENLKAQLQITAAQRTFQYSHVFQHVADAIVKTYQLLLDLYGSAENCSDAIMTGGTAQQQEEARLKLSESVVAFNNYFHTHRIYLPKKTMDNVWAFKQKIDAFTLRSAMFAAAARTGQRLAQRHEDKLETLRDEFPKLIESLHDEFQKILGLPQT